MRAIVFSLVTGLLLLVSCMQENGLSDAYGNFEASALSVSSDVSGKLISYKVNDGDMLEKNQLVAIVDTVAFHLSCLELEAQKDAVRTRIRSIDAQIATLREEEKTIKKEEGRLKKLYEDGAATEQKMDEMDGRIRVLESQAEALEVQKGSVYSEIKVIDSKMSLVTDKLSRCFIYNPVKGTVLESFSEQYEMIMAGKPVYKIADLAVMELKVYVDAVLLGRIKVGDAVKVMVDRNIDSNRELKGKISWISSTAEFTPKIIQTKKERVKLVYAVKIFVENDGYLKIGMPGEVVF